MNSQHTYISNPVKLIWHGVNSLLKHNQTLTLVIIGLGMLTTLGNGLPRINFENQNHPTNVVLTGLLFVIALLVGIFIQTMANGIQAYTVLQTINKQEITVEQAAKAAWSKFWVILRTEIIVFFKVLGGFLLFIIPGVRAALRYNLVFLPLFEQNATPQEAMQYTKDISREHLIEILGMSTAAFIVPIVGPLLNTGGQVVMYPQLKHLKKEGAAKPPVHWLNYALPLFIFGLFLVLVLLLTLIIAAMVNGI